MIVQFAILWFGAIFALHATVPGLSDFNEKFSKAMPVEFARAQARIGQCQKSDGINESIYLLVFIDEGQVYALLTRRSMRSLVAGEEVSELKAYVTSLERQGIFRAFPIEVVNGETIVNTPKGDRMVLRQVDNNVLVQIQRAGQVESCEFRNVLF